MKTKIAQSSTRTAPWWQELFRGGHFRSVFDIIPPKQTLSQVRFIIKALDLKKGDSLLDICCGIGRHLIPLAKRGIKPTGVDVCPEYLQEAEREGRGAKVKLNLICEDARKIKFHNKFSGAINMWTSIGFFEREADNYRVIENAHQALKSGGGFLLQTLNRDWLARNYSRKHWWEARDYKVLEEREFDLASSRLNMVWSFNRRGEEVQKKISIRIYCFHELREHFRKAGFEEITAYGGIDFSALTFDSPVLFIVGKKVR